MNRSERKRFVYINFMMKRINDASDRIYESLADSDEDAVRSAAEEMISFCNELLENVEDTKDQA